MERTGVSNSSPIILLSKTNRLELLREQFSHVVVPEEVVREVGDDFPSSWVEVRRVKDRSLLTQLGAKVHVGEAAAVALAREILGAVVVLDDLQARRFANQHGLIVVGTLGLVLRAKIAGRLRLARPVVEELRAAGLYLTDALVNRALADVGE